MVMVVCSLALSSAEIENFSEDLGLTCLGQDLSDRYLRNKRP
jgi:hypothetical protein